MANPYAGTPNGADWEAGLRAGLVVADKSVSAPLVLEPDARQAFDDGVAAGQFVNSALTPVEPETPLAEWVLSFLHDVNDVGGPIQSAVSRGVTKEGFWASIKAIGPEVAFNVGMLVAIWGPKRDSFWTDIVASRLSEIQAAIASGNGTDDNLELFMAVADPTGAGGIGDDPLAANGIQHGPFRLTFAEAQSDAAGLDNAANAYIHRYQTSQPTLVDVLRP